MAGGRGKIRFAVLLLGAAFLCGCATPRTADKPEEMDPSAVRLPIITPTKIRQPAGPQDLEPTISPTDVEDGKARSLKLFQIDYDRGKAGPAIGENSPGPSDSETNP
ncbi:MAG: hypothetical protein IH577_00030 [Deltaproteobacteria bacterium]|nr:hypothetical protein [Deltaproteobacteria bacterium]